MSSPDTSAKASATPPAKDPYVELAERIFVTLAARVNATIEGSEHKKPEPKALAAFCFKLADAFEQATVETPRKQAEMEAKKKASVKIDDVDLSGVLEMSKKKS
jgi:hypothetical protein